MSPNDRLHTTANDQTSQWKTSAQFPTLDRCCTNSATDMNQWARIIPPPTVWRKQLNYVSQSVFRYPLLVLCIEMIYCLSSVRGKMIAAIFAFDQFDLNVRPLCCSIPLHRDWSTSSVAVIGLTALLFPVSNFPIDRRWGLSSREFNNNFNNNSIYRVAHISATISFSYKMRNI